MSEQAIKNLKKRFVGVQLISFLVVMLFFGACIYLANAVIVRNTIRTTLDYIIENDGELLPHGDITEEDVAGDASNRELFESLQEALGVIRRFGIETRYQTRYFAVHYDASGNVVQMNMNHIAALTEEEAISLGNRMFAKRAKFGRMDHFYYKRAAEDKGTLLVAIDATAQMETNHRILWIAGIFLFVGTIICFLIARGLSGMVLQSELKNAELQREFVTNASHELKTPLAVIRANTELLEMTYGESEWTQSSLRHIDRMQGLIQSMVEITRSGEMNRASLVPDTDISVVVRDAVEAFRPMMERENKAFTEEIQDDIRMSADKEMIRQLVTLLLDNAVKYCDEGGQISIALKKSGRSERLIVSNTYAAGKDVDTSRFFDRFYREDSSHNTDKGGYGIGLSIAENIVKAHRGTIRADWKDGVISFICTL